MRFFWAAGLALTLAVAACDAPAPATDEPLATTHQPIIGGRPSTLDSAVLINEAGHPMCTGTMIAPNLVLTARHCVTYYNEDDPCGLPLGPDIEPVVFSVSVGPYATAAKTSARGTRIYVGSRNNGVCGADIALILLDREIPEVKIAKVRFTPPAMNETGVAVGYGDVGDGRRERPDVAVLAIGPTSSSYVTDGGDRYPMNLPANDFATGESTCFGDSGGPLLDSLGQVIGIASRGLPDDPDGCFDRPTYWTGVVAYEQMIRDAATAAGHPLAAAQSPPHFGNTVSNPGKRNGDGEDDEEDDDRTKSPRMSTSSAACAARPGVMSGPGPLALGLVFALALLRRRRADRG